MPPGGARVLAAWVLHLRGSGAPVADVRADDVLALVDGSSTDAVARVIAFLAPDLAGRTGLRATVVTLLADLAG